MGGWKQKSGRIQILPDSCDPFTFPFLSQLSVCLIVSRVRAYLTTDQQLISHFHLTLEEELAISLLAIRITSMMVDACKLVW